MTRLGFIDTGLTNNVTYYWHGEGRQRCGHWILGVERSLPETCNPLL